MAGRIAEKIEQLKENVEVQLGKRKPYPRIATFFENSFYDVEDRTRRRKQATASKVWFNILIFLNIVGCSVVLGYELDQNVGGRIEDRFWFFFADLFFLIVFTVEMFLRFSQLGWDYFMESWNIFDYSLVVINFMDFAASLDPVNKGGYKIASTFRICRCLRVSRHIEGIRACRGMWLVIEGMVGSFRNIFWTGVFIGVVLYGYGVVLSTILGQEADLREKWPDSDVYIGSVPKCILTVLQVFTFDSWMSVVSRPLYELGYINAVVMFLLAIVICNFGILNMVIALMVEKLASMKKQADLKAGQFLKKVEEDLLDALAVDFAQEDADGSGALDREEFDNLVKSERVLIKLRLFGIYTEEASNLFELLDADHGGTIAPMEFIEGIMKIRGEAKAFDLCKLVAGCKRSELKALDNIRKVRKVTARVDELQGRLDVIGKKLTGEVDARVRQVRRRGEMLRRAAERDAVITKMATEQRTFFPSVQPPSPAGEAPELGDEYDLGDYWN